MWRRWGFGDAPGEPYADARFPTDYIGQFYASWPPRIGGGGGGMAAGGMGGGSAMGAGGMGAGGMGGRCNDGGRWQPTPSRADNPNILALEALLERTGPAVLMPHSAGGPIIFNTAPEAPRTGHGHRGPGTDRMPDQPPKTSNRSPTSPSLPSTATTSSRVTRPAGSKPCRTTAALIEEMGGRGEMLELTEEGIRGNSHLYMQDDNSADIAMRVMDWLDSLAAD